MINLFELNEKIINHNCVYALAIDKEPATHKYNLLLSLGDSEFETCSKLNIYFHDVSALNICEFGGGLTQFMKLFIVRDEHGLDRVNFHLRDEEHRKIYFSFASFDVL